MYIRVHTPKHIYIYVDTCNDFVLLDDTCMSFYLVLTRAPRCVCTPHVAQLRFVWQALHSYFQSLKPWTQ